MRCRYLLHNRDDDRMTWSSNCRLKLNEAKTKTNHIPNTNWVTAASTLDSTNLTLSLVHHLDITLCVLFTGINLDSDFRRKVELQQVEDSWPRTGFGMSAVQSAWSARIMKKHSASAMAPRGRGATPFHQCWWSTPYSGTGDHMGNTPWVRTLTNDRPVWKAGEAWGKITGPVGVCRSGKSCVHWLSTPILRFTGAGTEYSVL